jgi:hypothetical protein
MAFHISHRYLELKPVLGAAARQLGLVGKYQDDLDINEEEEKLGKFRSSWAVLAESESALEVLDSRWEPLDDYPGARPWTDDFSNLVEAFLAGLRE